VIEHVDDLWSLKKFVDSVSSKKALLFVEAPNRRQYAQYYKNIYSNREHINNFDIFSIRRLFKDWSVVSFGERTANFNTYAVAWCLFSKKSLEEEYEKKYFKEVERMLNEGGREFVAWGAGEFAVQIIKKYKPKIKYFVDTFKHDSTLFGYKIYKPEKILEYKGSLVVLSTTKQEEIKRAAIKMGFKGKIVLF
jgi:hypothetical protein